MLIPRLLVISFLAFCMPLLPVSAATIEVNVSDAKGVLMSDAVVELISENNTAPATINIHEMRQQNRIFKPFVLAVQQGDKVEFPNFDRTRHHVYSFSPAKPFELKLYVGKTEAPIEFEKAGIVAIGCNIHDYMQAFIYVAQSPFYGVSNAKGQVILNDLSPGKYTVKVWHPWQLAPVDAVPLTITDTAKQTIELQLDIEHQQKPFSPPAGFGSTMPLIQTEIAYAK